MNDSLKSQNVTKDMNIINYIYDEQFIYLINSLSSAIKEYFQNFKHHIASLKVENDNINEHTTNAKSAINDILLFLTQTRTKSSMNNNEKYMREKCIGVSEKLDRINNVKENLIQQSKASEIIFMSFYDNAKESFKKMKIARNHKIDEINAKINFEEYVEKKREQNTMPTTSKSPSNKNIIGSNTSTVGVQMHMNMKMGNTLNQSHDDSIKKNDNELTMMKGKYNELLKENQNLKNMLSKLKNKEGNTLMNSSSSNSNTMTNNLIGKTIIANVKESLSGISQHKTRSLSKGNQSNSYMTCNTTGNEEHNLGKVSLIINNATITTNTMSNTINKGSGTLHLHKYSTLMSKVNNNKGTPGIKRNYSIDNKKSTLKPSLQEQRQHHKNHIPIDTSSTHNNSNINTYPVNHSTNKPLSNSNSTNNTINPNNTNTNTNGNSLNNSFSNQANLATLVISFITQMKALQESIAAKHENIKEMKVSFELKKKEIIKLSESILGISTGSMINTTMTSLNNTPRSAAIKKQTLPPNNNTNPMMNTIPNNKTDGELSQMKVTIQELEKKVKNEKSISSLYEEKLNTEKTQNKELNDMVSQLKEQLYEMKAKEKDSNEALIKDIQSYKETIVTLENEIKLLNESYEELKKSNEEYKTQVDSLTLKNKTLIEDNTTYTNEIARLKISITECNHNIITISNTNESIISEKDVMIKKLNKTLKEIQSEKDQLTKDIQSKSDLINELKALKEQDKTNDANNELIKDLNQTIAKYQQDLTQSKQENRDLMNKISTIKNEYLQYDQEKKAAETLLNELNETIGANIKELQKRSSINTDSTPKLETYPRTNNSIANDIAFNSELFALVMKCNQLMSKMTKNLETKIHNNKSTHEHMLIVQQNESLKKEIMKVQEEYERMKYVSSKECTSNRNNNPNKTLSNINEQNSNFIDDDLSNVSEIFLEEKLKEKSSRKDKESSKPIQAPPIQNKEEEDQVISPPILMSIEELITTMKIAFERLINSIQLEGSIKDDVITIFKLLNYKEDDIEVFFNQKNKKDINNNVP